MKLILLKVVNFIMKNDIFFWMNSASFQFYNHEDMFTPLVQSDCFDGWFLFLKLIGCTCTTFIFALWF